MLTPSERDGKEARGGVVEKGFVRYRDDRYWHRHPLGNSINTVDFIPCPSSVVRKVSRPNQT